MKFIWADSPALQGSWPEVLNHDVSSGGKPEEYFCAILGAEIEGQRSLVPADFLPPQRGPVFALTVSAHAVAEPRVLDFDDISAEVPQDLAAQRTGQDGRDVQHLDPVQWGGSIQKSARSANRNILIKPCRHC